MECKIKLKPLPTDAVCRCFCGWEGSHKELREIKAAALGANERMPAGRCPECNELAYVYSEPPEDCLQLVRRLKRAAEIAECNGDRALFALLSEAVEDLESMLT